MNTTAKRIIGLLMGAALPLLAPAQEKIQKAFDAIIDCKSATIVESHSLDRNPETGIKTGQSDVYRFTLPASKMNLVKDVLKAFRDDRDAAYSVNSGTINDGHDVVLAVGNAKKNNVFIDKPGYDYIYSCFLAPKSEDPEGIYRYAYALDYKLIGDKIDGGLIITYATTMKYRQDNTFSRLSDLGSWMGLGNPGDWDMIQGIVSNVRNTGNESWFRKFMKYVQGMTNGNSHTRRSLAGKLYEHAQMIGSYPDVSEQDKTTARKILKTLIAENKSHDTIVTQLLTSALDNIK